MIYAPYFTREDSDVLLHFDLALGTCKTIYGFRFSCGDDQEKAEMLKRHAEDTLEKFQEQVAKDPWYHLSPEKISELKRKLNAKWNARKHCWK